MNQSTTRRHIFLFLAFLCYVISNPVAAQQYKKQLGTTSTSTGFNNFNRKMQMLYTAADLGNPVSGVVDKIYFRKSFASPATVNFTNLQIKLGYTTTNVFPDNGNSFFTNLTPVLFSASQDVTGSVANTFFVIDVAQQFTLPTSTTLIVEVTSTSTSSDAFFVLASASPAAPNHKALIATDPNTGTGLSSTFWLDFGLDFTTNFSAPANNNCATATFKPMGSFCSPFLGNTVGATQSNAPVACGGATSSTAKDIWYSFVANGPTDSISVAGLGGFDPVIELFAGSCTTGLISLACSDDPQSGAATEVLAPGTLTAGQTYYFRVYGWNGIDGSFNACLKSDFVPAPVNDDCTFPTNLIPSSSCNSISGNTTGASEDLASQPCGGSTSTFANDLWYTFVATSAGDSVVVDPFDTFDPVLEIFSGSCSGLTQITCSDNPSFFDATEKVAPGTLIPGVTYIVRVYGFNGSEGLFNICVKSMAPVGAVNDNCTNAITLSGSTTCNATLGNSAGATQSIAPATCQGGTSSSAQDVWYKFVASGPGDSVIVSRLLTYDPVLEVFSGTCAGLVSLGCSDQANAAAIEKVAPGTLVAGQTYYVRVYGWAGTTGTFNICVKRVATSGVANDECANATTISVGTNCTFPVAGSTVGATTSPQTACSGFADDDVWYKFTVATSGFHKFKVTCLPGFDGVLEVYSGSCGALTSLACHDRGFTGDQEDTLLNLTAGQTIYVRIYDFYQGNFGAFGLCVDRVVAPSHDNCTGAMTMTVNTSGNCTQILTSNYGATQSLLPATCSGNVAPVANDVWIKFVATSANARVFVDNVGGSDPVAEGFSGTCSNLVSKGCVNDSTAGRGESLYMTNLTIGSTYFVRIYGNAPIYGDYNVCIQQVSCFSVAGTTNVAPLSIVSNASIRVNQTGNNGTIVWQYAFGGSNVFSSITGTNPDTFYVTGETDDVVAIRAQVTNGVCAPAFSTPVNVTIECATPITQKNSLGANRYITNVNFSGINNNSTADLFKGAYQNFKNVSGSLCLGTTKSLSVSMSSTGMYVAAWIDFNNDGDYDDANENILSPTLSNSTLFSSNIFFPNTVATSGVTVPMRVFVFNPGTSTPSSSACFAGPYDSGEIEEYSIQILSAPTTANAGPNFTSCAPTVNLAGNAPTSGTGTWTLLSGSGSIINPTSSTSPVSNLGQGANVFRWTISNSCGTSFSEVVVTYSGPGQVATAGADQTICSTTATLAGNVPAGTATGTWTSITGNGIVNSPNSSNSGVSGLSEGINRFVWTLSVPGCGTSKDTVTITRFASPTPAFVGVDQNICVTSFVLTGNTITVGTGVWTLISGSGTIVNPSQPNSQVTGLGSGNNTFRWTSSNGTCPVSTDDLSIVVTPTVPAQAGSDQTLCSNQAVLSGNNPSPSTGIWTLLSGSGTLVNPTSFNASVTGLGSGVNTFVWTISNGNCPQSKDTVRITRVLPQTASAGQDQSVCGGQGNLQANPVSSGTGIWTVVSGSGIIEDPSNPNSLLTALGNGQNVFRWTVTNPPCSQSTDDVIITNLGNATIAQAGQDQTLCNTQVTLSGNNATFGIGQWSLVSGAGTITSPTSPTSTVTGLGTGLNVFRWTITNGNCPPSFDDVVISRVAAPSVAFAGADQNICTNSGTLTATAPSVGNGLWTLVAGSGQILDATNAQTQVTGLGTGANTFRWTISNSPCAASTDEVIINSTTNAVAAVAGQDQVLCSETAQLSGNNAGTGTGTWTVVSGSGTFTNANSPTTQVTALGTGVNVFRWTITNGACPPSSDEVIVDRYSSVTLAFAGTDQTLCTSTATLTGTTPQSGTGLWTLVSGTGTITNPTSSVTTVTGLGNGDNVFRWTISNIPCPSSADDVVISTTLSAVTANAGTDQTVCGAVSQLIGNNPGTGTGVWTLVSGSGNITNPNGSQTSVTGLGAGVNVFSWTVTSGACQPSVDQVQITVVTNPVAANAGADQTICGSSANLTANAPGQGVGSWSLVSGSGTIGNPTSTSTTVIGLGNGANVFRWTISNAPCAPSFDEITINATPGNVTAQAGADKIICGSSTFLNATAPGTGFGVWSLVSGSGTIAQPGNPVSEITNLGSGINTFAWTVTSGSCNASDLVQITKEINTLDLGDDSIACIGTPVVLNAGTGFADYSWFDNSGTPTVTVGASGQYWVQVLTSNGCSFRDTIKVTFVICTDVEQTLTKSDVLEIYPNPGNGFFHLNFESASAAKSTVRMYNSTGVQVLEKELDLTDGKASQDLDLRGAPSGLYIMEVQNDKVRHIRKLIVR
jgi:hypothetical protein